MRRHLDSGNDTPGYDSFLDIVANLVGILVILIMVLGVQARDAFQQTSDQDVAVVEDITDESMLASEVPATPDAFADVNSIESSDPPTADALTLPDESAVLALSPPAGDTNPGGFDFPPIGEPASDALSLSAPEPAAPLLMPDVESVRIEAEELRQAAYQVETDLAQVDAQLTAKSAYRDQLLAALNVAQEQVTGYNAQIAAVALAKDTDAADLAAAQAQLANIQGQIDRVSTSSEPEPIALNHRLLHWPKRSLDVRNTFVYTQADFLMCRCERFAIASRAN